jgi:predicted O-methyltransferase YrrM
MGVRGGVPHGLVWWGIAKNQHDMDDIYAGVSARFSSDARVKIKRLRSIDAASTFQDAYFDWVYIDGDHSYSAVMNDLFAWSTKVKPGGILCGDDLYWRDESRRPSVSSAVADFAREINRLYDIILPDQFMFVM